MNILLNYRIKFQDIINSFSNFLNIPFTAFTFSKLFELMKEFVTNGE